MKRCLFAALFALVAASAFAQDAYPSRPITMIVPFPPGGVADITGRPTAAAMEKVDRKSTRLNSSHIQKSRMPSSA